MKKLLLKNLCKKYDDDSYAVRNINLEVEDKDFIILVGPSGCGKSTTLRMVAGLEDISEGEMWLDGKFANYLDHKERDLSMVFQNYALYPTMNVYDNISFSLKVRKIDKKLIDEKVQEVADIMGIKEYLERMPKELSGGQRQRVAIAGAIIRNPQILLMDEPLSNLDAKLRTHMRVELAKLHKNLNNTIIYVTHDQTEAMTLGTKIVVLNEGTVQQSDTPEQIYNNPKNKFVAGFMGLPPMNFIETRIKCFKNRDYFYLGDAKIYLSKFHKEIAARKGYENKDVIIGIRPEFICSQNDKRNIDKEHISASFSVVVDLCEMLGDKTVIYFKIRTDNFCAIMRENSYIKAGDSVKLFINTEKICIFDIDTKESILYDSLKGGISIE